MPRAGTTWLARLLADSPGTALAGREPLNPRHRQFALGGTLSGWARLSQLSLRQKLALRTSYAGVNPLVYSRYGKGQARAALPGSRVIVKDPFAVLSIPVILQATHAQAVIVYRHPGAALASYRRMGWSADLDELRPIVEAFNATPGMLRPLPDIPRLPDVDEATAMAVFWTVLYGMALADTAGMNSVTVVSHAEIAGGGAAAHEQLCRHLGLAYPGAAGDPPAAPAAKTSEDGAPVLHNFDRDPAEVARSWKAAVSDDELAGMESVARPVLERLEATRLVLSG
jgi:hypothetical protein